MGTFQAVGYLALNTLATLVGWLAAALVLVGIGLAVRHAAGLRRVAVDDGFQAFWTGLAAVVLFLQVWHFWQPVNAFALGILVSAGVGGLVLCREGLAALLAGSRWRESRWTWATLTLVLLWTASLAAGTPGLADTGIYHAQVVRWNSEYPIVPGLGNLHGRLAFNNSGLLYAALFNVGPLAGRASHFANGSLITALLVQSLWNGRRVLHAKEPRERCLALFSFLLLAPVVDCVTRNHLRSFSTDLHASAAIIAGGTQLMRYLLYPEMDRRETRFQALVMSGLLAAAVCMKLNAVAFAAAGLAVIWSVHIFRWRRPAGLRDLAVGAAVVLVLLLPWSARGITLSGYPAYPLTAGGLAVPWRVPRNQADAELAWVRHHAHYQSQTQLGIGWDWLRPWVGTMLSREYTWTHALLPLVLLAFLPAAWRARGRGGRIRWPPEAVLVVVPPAVGIVVWFLSAPTPRFGWAPLWLLAAAPIAFLYGGATNVFPASRRALVAAGAVLAVQPVVIRVTGAWATGRWRGAMEELARAAIPPRDAASRGLPRLRQPARQAYLTASGLVVGTGLENGRCWDAPLPCTPHPSPNLVLRGHDLSSGFEIHGPWQPVNYPNPESRFLELWRCARREPGNEAWARQCLARIGEDSAVLSGPWGR